MHGQAAGPGKGVDLDRFFSKHTLLMLVLLVSHQPGLHLSERLARNMCSISKEFRGTALLLSSHELYAAAVNVYVSILDVELTTIRYRSCVYLVALG